jgi:transposase-like protein
VHCAGAPGLEEQSRTFLQSLRWPAGVECPRCAEHIRLLRLESRGKWNCYRCRYQFSVTAGTLFHRSHLPIWKWLAAVHLMLDTPEGVSAGELSRQMGGSYKTAWFAAHRIRAAMRSHDHERRASTSPRRLRLPANGGEPGPVAVIQLHRPLAPVRGVDAGPHHHLSAKHVLAYLDERRWRAANRGNPHVFRDTVAALLGGESVSYVRLVSER